MTVNGGGGLPDRRGTPQVFYPHSFPTQKKRCQYDYRDTDGELFSCVAPTLEECRAKRDIWLNNRNNK